MRVPLVVCAAALLAAACGKSKEIPAAWLGSYERPVGMGLRHEELSLTPTGAAARSGAEMSESLGVLGHPMLEGSARFGAGGAALFTSIECARETCRFRTKGGAEGTLTYPGDGSLVIVATGECASWSGKWTRPVPGSPAAASGPQPAASRPQPAADPLAQVPCRIACAEEQMDCHHECRIDDEPCNDGCRAKLAACGRACR